MSDVDVLPDVYLNTEALRPFLLDAADQYRRAWSAFRGPSGERYLPRCWALLVGQATPRALRVGELRWAENVRESDADVMEEFTDVIAPCFGSAYAHGRRGYWCDPRELLHITREVERRGMDVLGSIHMHADMHRFWPEHAARQELSEHPTAMDAYLFRNGGWPLNVICHLEGRESEIVPRFGAWAPPPFDDEDAEPRRMPVRLTMGGLTPAPGAPADVERTA